MVSDSLRIPAQERFSCLNPCCSGIWSRTLPSMTFSMLRCQVLILVVVEYGLGQAEQCLNEEEIFVLILVVVEYGLGPQIILG